MVESSARPWAEIVVEPRRECQRITVVHLNGHTRVCGAHVVWINARRDTVMCPTCGLPSPFSATKETLCTYVAQPAA